MDDVLGGFEKLLRQWANHAPYRGSLVHPTATIFQGVEIRGHSELGPTAILGRDSLVHSACVEGVIGPRTKVWRWAHVSAGARIGSDCMIGQGVFIADDVRIGNNVRVQNHTDISRHVTIERNVSVGAGVRFCNARHFSHIDPNLTHKPILVEAGAVIGSNVCIMGGVTIGAGAIIGANAVITHDVPSGGTMIAPGVKGTPQ